MLKSLPGFVNAHTHSPYGPQYAGVTGTQSFESYIIDITARQKDPYTPKELAAFALVTGLDNLSSGNTAIIDQCYLPLTSEAVYAVARAYEQLGLRAWIFTELSDMPFMVYTREAYPNFSRAIPLRQLPEELQLLCTVELDYRDQLTAVRNIIKEWHGRQVRLGIGLSNAVWCSDDLLSAAAALAREMDVPLTMHVEESPMQHGVHLAQWGMSAIPRLEKLGLLSSRLLLSHVVQVDDADIATLAKYDVSVSHNPTSNLKLRNGIFPAGKMIRQGVNVCLGSDGHSSGDSQSLFPVMEIFVALGELNGLFTLDGEPEAIALKLAVDNGHKLWFDGDLSQDRMEFSSPVGLYAFVWDSPACKIEEVIINGSPCLQKAREIIRESGADKIVIDHMAKLTDPEVEWQAKAAVKAVMTVYNRGT